jgi:hypothetical protein
MTRRHRIIFLAALVATITVACGASKKDVERARNSVYDTDFANVYNAALQATRDLYPMLKDSPGPGRISTAWHQVTYANNQDDSLQNQRTLQQQGVAQGGISGQAGSPQSTMTGMPTRLAYKRFFIRFDVSVLGGRPWRVKVVGRASEWDPGAALPTEMNGAQRPAWLDGRTDALQVAIYKKIKKYAIARKEEVVVSVEDSLPKTDPNTFKGVPPAAAKTLAAIKDAIGKRDYAALRPQLDDNVVWSLGGGTGADIAIATWQADPGILEAMLTTINAGCAGDKKVMCPAADPQPGAYQLVLEDKGGTFKVTSFVRAE